MEDNELKATPLDYKFRINARLVDIFIAYSWHWIWIWHEKISDDISKHKHKNMTTHKSTMWMTST